MFLFAVAAACLLASMIGVALFVRLASYGRWLDVPNERSSHQVPTPRGAGLVIVIVVSAAMAWAARAGVFRPDATALAALTIAAISAVDDVRSLPSGLRLLVHLVCAVVAVLTITGSGERSWSGPLIVLAVIWIVGLTNAYNFMDGIDGISGAQAVVAGVAFTLAAMHVGIAGPATCSLAIAAASAGFLIHNWPPARVFMGDVGSAFVGFSFAVMVLQIWTWSPALGVAAAMSLWPFAFDTVLTFLRRAVRRENVLQSHRSHFYQRLVIAGWSHARVTILYTAAAAVGAISGLAWALHLSGWQVLTAVPMMALAIYTAVRYMEAAARNSSSKRGNAGAAAR
jgi:UDP-N-acetylmuramyl pentapeptide phosphotransferase/UDP-N-acetylglucosamine-1-phosphate transferase